MLKFFRKIRHDLIANNKSYKYFKYAIGEIVLVVIGILIALQINTWNEQNKTLEKFERQLVKVKKELSSNSESLTNFVNYNQRKDSMLYIVRKGLLTVEMLEKNKDYAYLTKNYYPLNIEDEEFRILSNIDIDLTKEQDSIITVLKGIYNLFKPEIDDIDNILKDKSMSIDNDLMNSKDWYFSMNNGINWSNQIYDYFLKDPFHLNHVEMYSTILLKNLIPGSLMARSEMLRARKLISQHLNEIDGILDYPVDEYKHFIGLYEGDEASIKIENRDNKLHLIWIENEVRNTAQEIFPISKTCFTAMDNVGYFYLRLDTINNAEKIVESHRMRTDEYIRAD